MNIKEQAKKDYKEFLTIIDNMEDRTLNNIKKQFNVLDKGFFCFVNYNCIELSMIYKDDYVEFYKLVYIVDDNHNFVDTFEVSNKSFTVYKINKFIS